MTNTKIINPSDFNFIETSAGLIHNSQLQGWVGATRPELLREAFNMISSFIPFKIYGSAPIAGARSMLWEVGRKVLGKDTPNYAQEIGDCVSFGAKNAIEYVQFYPIANGIANTFKQVFPPYLYGCGRVLVGGGRMGNEDGSLGSWQAEAVMKYGTISLDTEGCPAYSGQIAKQWGSRGSPDNFVTIGKTHIVKSAANIKTWDELCTALVNGYPVTIASDVGFDMKQRSDGFFYNSTSWGHQMCIIGMDNAYKEPHACILNSWSDSHGQIKDFTTGEMWPMGTLRVHQKDIEKILSQGDSFVYSSFDGFPAQELPRNFFSFI